MNNAIRATVIGIAAAACSTVAQADDEKKWFVAVDTGEVRATTFTRAMNDGTPATPATVRTETDSTLNRLRLGYHMSEGATLEFNYGQGDDDGDQTGPIVDSHFAVYVVPRIRDFFGFMDVNLQLGYAEVDFEGSQEKMKGVAYGVNLSLNGSYIAEQLSWLRLTGGFNVLSQDGGERVSGYNYGIRFDF